MNNTNFNDNNQTIILDYEYDPASDSENLFVKTDKKAKKKAALISGIIVGSLAIILVAVIIIVSVVNSAKTEESSIARIRYSHFVSEELVPQYGICEIPKPQSFETGISSAKILDMNNDATDELIVLDTDETSGGISFNIECFKQSGNDISNCGAQIPIAEHDNDSSLEYLVYAKEYNGSKLIVADSLRYNDDYGTRDIDIYYYDGYSFDLLDNIETDIDDDDEMIESFLNKYNISFNEVIFNEDDSLSLSMPTGVDGIYEYSCSLSLSDYDTKEYSYNASDYTNFESLLNE